MLPALWFQRLRALRGEQRDGGLAGAEFPDAADQGDWNAGNLAGQAGRGGGGEEQFVVFATVEGLGQGCGRVDGQGRGIDLCGHAGLPA